MKNAEISQKCDDAVALLQKGDSVGAVMAFQSILIQDPTCALAWNNRGLALMQLGHPFDGILNIERAIDLEPQSAEYHSNKGAALFNMDEMELALESYTKAISIRPKFPEALMNIGNLLRFNGRYSEAINYYQDSIAARPEYVEAHLGLSFSQLSSGDYLNGWKEFEWRWKTNQMVPRGLKIPEWNGEPLDGKTILIYGEQGFGDSLQFMRYAPFLKSRQSTSGAPTVYVEVRAPLARIMKSLNWNGYGVDGIYSFGEELPKGIDYAVAVMSLPRILGTTVDNIPNKPYLTADKHRAAVWDDKLSHLPPGLKVGICWAGMSRPGHPEAANIDKRRSTSLDTFAPVALVPGVSWVSLQKGPPSSQVNQPPRGMTIGDWTEELDDFYDTAALIDRLDLVISVDTAVVHLAAALGKPTWLLSRWDGCWRWLGQREDSPWYPSLRQFSQPAPGDWKSLMQTVAIELNRLVRQNSVRAA